MNDHNSQIDKYRISFKENGWQSSFLTELSLLSEKGICKHHLYWKSPLFEKRQEFWILSVSENKIFNNKKIGRKSFSYLFQCNIKMANSAKALTCIVKRKNKEGTNRNSQRGWSMGNQLRNKPVNCEYISYKIK